MKDLIEKYGKQIQEMGIEDYAALKIAIIGYEMSSDGEVDVDRALIAYEAYMDIDDARLFSDTIVETYEDYDERMYR